MQGHDLQQRMLHLDGRQALRVLRDGPALRVRQRGAADRMFPLQRLSSIWVSGHVEWQSSALLACAGAGIPVCFFDGRGVCQGIWQAGPNARQSLAGLDWLFEAWLSTRAGIEAWQQWFNARLHNQVKASTEMAGACFKGTAAAHARFRERQLSLIRSRDLQYFEGRLQGYLDVWVDLRWRDLGVDTDAAYWRLAGLHPIQDLSILLTWLLLPAQSGYFRQIRKHQHLRLHEKGRLNRRDVVEFMTCSQGQIETAYSQHVRSLQGIALEALLGKGETLGWSEVV